MITPPRPTHQVVHRPTRQVVRRHLGETDTTGPAPTFCFDAGYDAIALTHELAGLREPGGPDP